MIAQTASDGGVVAAVAAGLIAAIGGLAALVKTISERLIAASESEADRQRHEVERLVGVIEDRDNKIDELFATIADMRVTEATEHVTTEQMTRELMAKDAELESLRTELTVAQSDADNARHNPAEPTKETP